MPEKDLNGSLETANHVLIKNMEPLKLPVVVSRQISNTIVSRFEQDTANDSHSQRNKLVERAVHWCLVNGFVMVPKHIKSNDLMCVTYLPFTLFPTPFRRADLKQVFDLQPQINMLVSKIASSSRLIENALGK
jgi:hypothetical protein